jgi:hypothetical protein
VPLMVTPVGSILIWAIKPPGPTLSVMLVWSILICVSGGASFGPTFSVIDSKALRVKFPPAFEPPTFAASSSTGPTLIVSSPPTVSVTFAPMRMFWLL